MCVIEHLREIAKLRMELELAWDRQDMIAAWEIQARLVVLERLLDVVDLIVKLERRKKPRYLLPKELKAS